MNSNKDTRKNDILANIAIINGIISFFLIFLYISDDVKIFNAKLAIFGLIEDFFALQFSNNEVKIVIGALINFLALIIGSFVTGFYIPF